MRVPRLVPLLVVCMAVITAACGSSTPSPTVRPEFVWQRAQIDLPADVVDVAPGSSAGIVCSPCHAQQASLMTAIASTGTGLLAVGMQLPPSSAIAYRSTDGREWAPDPGLVAEDGTSALATTADGSRQVIVGTRGAAAATWVLPAGATAWEPAPDQPSLHAGAGTSAVMRAVTPWRSGLVAVGSLEAATGRTAAIWTSDDGLAWTLRSDGPSFEDATAFGVAASDDRLVVVGATGGSGAGPAVAWASDDGVTWTQADAAGLAAGPMRAVTRTPTGFVAVGVGSDDDRAVAWTSSDGVAWSAQPASKALENGGKAIRMLAVAASGRRLVAAGWKSDAGNGSGVTWTSADGASWDRVTDQVSMSGASLAGITFAGTIPVAVGTSGYPDNDQASVWFEGP